MSVNYFFQKERIVLPHSGYIILCLGVRSWVLSSPFSSRVCFLHVKARLWRCSKWRLWDTSQVWVLCSVRFKHVLAWCSQYGRVAAVGHLPVTRSPELEPALLLALTWEDVPLPQTPSLHVGLSPPSAFSGTTVLRLRPLPYLQSLLVSGWFLSASLQVVACSILGGKVLCAPALQRAVHPVCVHIPLQPAPVSHPPHPRPFWSSALSPAPLSPPTLSW